MAYMNDVEIDNMNRWRSAKNQDLAKYSKNPDGTLAELL
jgi:hypothetical protein